MNKMGWRTWGWLLALAACLGGLCIAPIELGSAEGVIAAVEAGWGISWVSMVVAQRAFEMGKIRIVEVEGLSLRRIIYLVRHRQRASTAAQLKFYEFVHSLAGKSILRKLGIREEQPAT